MIPADGLSDGAARPYSPPGTGVCTTEEPCSVLGLDICLDRLLSVFSFIFKFRTLKKMAKISRMS